MFVSLYCLVSKEMSRTAKTEFSGMTWRPKEEIEIHEELINGYSTVEMTTR